MKTDVAIIGGGVIGVACALELARRGAQVVVLERDRVGHGCSFGNAGWLTPSQAMPLANPNMLFKSFRWMLDPESPLYVQPRLDPSYLRWLAGFLLSSRAREVRARRRGAGRAVPRQRRPLGSVREGVGRCRSASSATGCSPSTRTQASFEGARGAIDLVAQIGRSRRALDAEQVREREPAIVGAQVGGYFFPDDAHCEPYKAVRALAAEAARAGVTFVEGAEVFGDLARRRRSARD